MLDKLRPSVLVVDDNKQNLKLIGALLKPLDINVELVSSGKEALVASKAYEYFLILMDVKMPSMNGFETVSLIRENEMHKMVPIIFITGMDEENFEFKSYEEGAVDYIVKPLKVPIFLSKVSIFLKLYRQQKVIENYAGDLDEKVIARTKELTIAKDKAIAASVAKSNFLSSISHELRTPMHGILSYANLGMLNSSKGDVKKIDKYFTNINTSATRLMGLLNDLLDLAKLESGKIDVKFKKKSLLEIVVSCINEQQARLDELGIYVVCNPNSTAMLVDVDEQRISQVVTNLLSNAIKFTDKGNVINIDIAETHETQLESNTHDENKHNDDIATIVFSIRDHGAGIKRGEEEIIFDDFVQGSDTVIGTVKGTGLGLPICKEIIGLHQGKIWTKNHVDGGAVFNFSIPVEQSESETPRRRVGDLKII